MPVANANGYSRPHAVHTPRSGAPKTRAELVDSMNDRTDKGIGDQDGDLSHHLTSGHHGAGYTERTSASVPSACGNHCNSCDDTSADSSNGTPAALSWVKAAKSAT